MEIADIGAVKGNQESPTTRKCSEMKLATVRPLHVWGIVWCLRNTRTDGQQFFFSTGSLVITTPTEPSSQLHVVNWGKKKRSLVLQFFIAWTHEVDLNLIKLRTKRQNRVSLLYRQR